MKKDPSVKHLAHDLNNIFTRILNSIDLLKRKVTNIDTILPILNNIESGTYLASEMIDDTFGNISNKITQRKINLNSIIADIVRSYILQQKDKINFLLSLEKDLKLVNGKYSDFYRVILNLIINSIEAINTSGAIRIKTCNLENEDKIQIIINDDGSGIEEQFLSQVFNEDYSTKNKNKISGVGLSIVKEIIEDHNGTISVSSEVGKGSEFIITLNSSPILHDKPAQSGKTILIAEDEDILRELLTELLQSYDYTILTASNGIEVLDFLKVRTPDLLIVDKKMPEMDGLTCLQE
ncbi:MAG: hybrid sensor histidine kinase/response regulator, partial [Ignavibacteriales bacterium]|nr:hybrid sensor histidine kinase/response regulator [Ignavibacteriales bacterium]